MNKVAPEGKDDVAVTAPPDPPPSSPAPPPPSTPSTPSTFQVSRTQPHKMLITDLGRVKMIHQSCNLESWDEQRRSKEKSCETQPQNDVQPIELITAALKSNPVVDKKTECQSGGVKVAIEFDVSEAIAAEGVKQTKVPLRRIGDTSGRLECRYTFENGNMLAPLFLALNPEVEDDKVVVFEDGQSETTITVPIVDDPTWNVEMVYFIDLDPESLSTTGPRATLGDNARIGVFTINDDSFPSGVPSTGSITQFVKGFLKHNYSELPKETRWGCVYMMFPAVKYYLGARILALLLNCGVSPEKEYTCVTFGIEFDVSSPDSRMIILFVLAGAQFFLSEMNRAIKKMYRKLRLGGKAVRILRTNLFTTMLQLSQDAKEGFDAGDVPKALDTQVEAAIKGVWLPAFQLFGSLLQLILQYVITFQIALDSKKLPIDKKLLIILICPIMILFMVVTTWLRAKPQLEKHRAALEADDNWSAFVTMAETNTQLILNYQHGPTMAETFHAAHAQYNKRGAGAADFSDQSVDILKRGFDLAFALVVVMGGIAVQEQRLQIGGFVVLCNAVKGFGSQLSGMGVTINKMVVGTAAVKKVAEILNKDTRRRVLLRRMRHGGAGWRSSEEGCHLQLENVSYNYPGTSSSVPTAVPSVNLKVPSGHLVCFPVRTHNEAKSPSQPDNVMIGTQTLFKLISRQLIPDVGAIVYPARWRVICVPIVPLLFDGTLMYNLSFSKNCPADEKTVWQVCSGLGLSKELLGLSNFDVGNQGDALRFSDRLIVSIARALLHEVDLLLIPSTLDVIGQEVATLILQYLSTYIHKRGLVADEENLPLELQHVKTILYSTKFSALEKLANSVIGTEDRVLALNEELLT